LETIKKVLHYIKKYWLLVGLSLVLAAVMLCGNMLNTLAVTGLLGCGVIMLYVLVLVLFESSMDTFITDAVTIHRQLIYGSPLVSAVWLLIRQLARVEDASCFIDTVKVEPDFVRAVALNLALALALGAAAVFLYDRRPSELAEQGVRNRPVRFLLQLLAGIMAGIGGWKLFYFVDNIFHDIRIFYLIHKVSGFYNEMSGFGIEGKRMVRSDPDEFAHSGSVVFIDCKRRFNRLIRDCPAADFL